MKKLCKKCGETKPLEAFIKDVRYAQGRFCYCRQCKKTYYATYWGKRKTTTIFAVAHLEAK
jgi:hypothetical protein